MAGGKAAAFCQAAPGVRVPTGGAAPSPSLDLCPHLMTSFLLPSSVGVLMEQTLHGLILRQCRKLGLGMQASLKKTYVQRGPSWGTVTRAGSWQGKAVLQKEQSRKTGKLGWEGKRAWLG